MARFIVIDTGSRSAVLSTRIASLEYGRKSTVVCTKKVKLVFMVKVRDSLAWCAFLMYIRSNVRPGHDQFFRIFKL